MESGIDKLSVVNDVLPVRIAESTLVKLMGLLSSKVIRKGKRGASGKPYTSCLMGKMLESYLKPRSRRTLRDHCVSCVIEYVGAR